MWYKIKNQHIELQIFAKPNAKKTALLGIDDQGLQVAIHARPQEGAANEALIAFLAKLFGLRKNQMILQSGGKSRHKRIQLPLTPTTQRFLDDPAQFFDDKKC